VSLIRSGFKRPVYERPARSPLHRVESQRGVYADVDGVVRAVPKEVIHRSEAYRRFVAAQECFGCRITSFSQCAHLNERKGLALKTCDSTAFPLCAARHGVIGCHQAYDLGLDGLGRDERREWALRLSAQMQARARAAGWRFDETGIHKP